MDYISLINKLSKITPGYKCIHKLNDEYNHYLIRFYGHSEIYGYQYFDNYGNLLRFANKIDNESSNDIVEYLDDNDIPEPGTTYIYKSQLNKQLCDILLDLDVPTIFCIDHWINLNNILYITDPLVKYIMLTKYIFTLLCEECYYPPALSLYTLIDI